MLNINLCRAFDKIVDVFVKRGVEDQTQAAYNRLQIQESFLQIVQKTYRFIFDERCLFTKTCFDERCVNCLALDSK